jgi:hypothetical protein
MLLAKRWIDLVVHEVCFVKKMIEIRKKKKTSKVLNWQDEKVKWEFCGKKLNLQL